MVRRYPTLVNPPGRRVDDLFVAKLNVKPDLVPLSGNHHTRTAFGMDDAAITNVWEVGFRDGVDYTPDVIYGETFIVSRGKGLQ